MKLFIGSRSELLGKKVAETTGLPIGNWKLTRFGDSEIKPVIEEEEVRGQDIILFASTSNPVNNSYMEFFLLADAIKRSAAGKVIAVLPYFGYARQNQQHLPGEPVSAHVMTKFIQSVGIDELVTVDLHEEQLTGFFDIPVTHLSALPLLAKAIGEEIKVCHAELVSASRDKTLNQVQGDEKSIIVVSPDQGGVERTRKFRDALAEYIKTRHPEGEKMTEGSIHIDSSPRLDVGTQNDKMFIVDEEIGIVEKLRNLERTHETKMVEITGDIHGKIVVIPDDVIVSGGTILHAVEAAKEKGASAVYLAATHADFIEGTAEKLQDSPVEKVFVTDTIAITDNQHFQKLQVFSVADLLAQAIKKLRN